MDSAEVEDPRAADRATSEMDLARKRLDEAVARASRRHAPLGSPPFLLAGAAGVIAGAVMGSSVSWALAITLSLAVAALTCLVLVLFRVASWSRQHPLLAQMHVLLHKRRRGEDAEQAILELGEAIARHYLPASAAESLRAALVQARAQSGAMTVR